LSIILFPEQLGKWKRKMLGWKIVKPKEIKKNKEIKNS
jgi:hypothetical protein